MKTDLLIAGNWKMNKTLTEMQDFWQTLSSLSTPKSDVMICTPSLYAMSSIDLSPQWVKIATQNVSTEDFGAYTGELSAPMLKSAHIHYTLVGHSERRQYYGDTDAIIHHKLKRCFDHLVTPILCIGESLEQRDMGHTYEVLSTQLEQALVGLDHQQLIIAYEPVWAIGTGRSATPEQAQDAHAFIRKWLIERYGVAIANQILILYGGSLNENNAYDLLSQPDINGGLIGSASLSAETFSQIIATADSLIG